MNLRSNETRLLKLCVSTTSVTIQYWISLKRRINTSKLAVICIGTEKMYGKVHVCYFIDTFIRIYIAGAYAKNLNVCSSLRSKLATKIKVK